MKTLKKDDVNEKLLIQTLAYIESHEALWEQGSWRKTEINGRCKTPMCFAGHTVVTLKGARDAISLPPVSAFKAAREGRATAKQIDAISDWYATEEYVEPTKAELDSGRYSTVELANGTSIKATFISSRAIDLLGTTAVSAGRTGNLFAGDNSLADIRQHIADVLGYDLDKLEEKVRATAKANRWRIPKATSYSG